MEREEQYLEDEYAAGHISLAEFNAQMRELQRDYRAEAEESAMDAYQDRMHDFGY